MIRIINLAFIVLLTSCSHRSQIKKDLIVTGRCEEEFNKTELSKGQSIWQEISHAGGAGVSYLITGLGYSTDVVVSFSGGVIGSIAICSPVIALEIAAAGNSPNSGQISGDCLVNVGVEVAKNINTRLGPKSEKLTHKWQCPSLDNIAQGLLKVADCYSSSGEKLLAKLQLQKMKNSNVFQNCLSAKYKKKIEEKLLGI